MYFLCVPAVIQQQDCPGIWLEKPAWILYNTVCMDLYLDKQGLSRHNVSGRFGVE